MKTILNSCHRSALRLALPLLFTGLAAPAVHAAALERANVYLTGKQFGNGQAVTVLSGKEKIARSKRYQYQVDGLCKGTGTLASLVPAGTNIGRFMDSIAPGSSKFLKGTFENPSGTLPCVLVDRRISGSENINGLGKVSVSTRLRVEILATGEIVLKLSNVSIKAAGAPLTGTIAFQRGAKAVITTSPIIEMRTPGKDVDENAGAITIEVMRYGYQKQKASIRYRTVDETAIAGTDYISQSGTILFASGELSKSISIPITDNALVDGYRRFKVVLETPGDGAVLGARTNTRVGIRNDD